ncbi:MAG: BBP7 family outer membrane beta-barrel protein [Thermoguttaceae bacterium]|jgi:hypothetical protein
MAWNRIRSGLTFLVLIMLPGFSAYAQDLRALQLFEDADMRPYGNWAQPKEGFYASFDGLFWYMNAPDKQTVGFGNTSRLVMAGTGNLAFGTPAASLIVTSTATDQYVETSTFDTGDFRDKWKAGDRIELGYTGEHDGFLISTFELNTFTLHSGAANVPVVFQDPPFGATNRHLLENVFGLDVNGNPIWGNVPVVYDTLRVTNMTKPTGVEAMYTYRDHQLHRGGQLQWMIGARYLEIKDEYLVDGIGGGLGDTHIDSLAKNEIFGPQVGVRFYQPFGRFAISSEGRFAATVNSEQIRVTSVMGTNLSEPANPLLFTDPNTLLPILLPRLMGPTSGETSAHYYFFTPLVEFRVEGHVQVTQSISAKVGWNAVWMDNIARGSGVLDYSVPQVGITTASHGNRQDLFMQGLSLGVELNR